MAKYVFVYHGGGKPKDQDEITRVMDAWGKWMGGMGSALIDGGNPVGKSTTVNSDGSVTDNGGANPISGYTLIEAATLDDAIKHAKNCPILAHGGSIELAEAIDM